MTTWAQRAKAHFSQERQSGTAETAESTRVLLQERQTGTAETAETPLLAVLAVRSGAFCEKHDFQSEGESAANDPAPAPTKATVLPPADSASGAVIDIGTIRPPGLSAKLLAASMALDAQIQAAGQLRSNNPDSDCWPHSTAMTGSENDTHAARLVRFTRKGLVLAEAEVLVDKLVTRDRETDDRRLCLECTHLGGYGHSSWRCGNWQAAGVARQARDAQLPVNLVQQLQRCAGFNPTTKVS